MQISYFFIVLLVQATLLAGFKAENRRADHSDDPMLFSAVAYRNKRRLVNIYTEMMIAISKQRLDLVTSILSR